MSAISLSWVATVKVGNQTAKQLLQFYASHNFNKPGFEFKTKTLAEQLEVDERSIRRAHLLLVKKGFVRKEERFGKDGSQLSSLIYLNIPQEFVDNFFSAGRGADIKSGGGGHKVPPRADIKSPLSIKNNNINKERAPARKKRVPLPVDYAVPESLRPLIEKTSIRVGLDGQTLITKFKNVHRSSGKVSEDWNAELENFLITERPYLNKVVKINHNEGVPAVNRSKEFVSERNIRRIGEVMNR